MQEVSTAPSDELARLRAELVKLEEEYVAVTAPLAWAAAEGIDISGWADAQVSAISSRRDSLRRRISEVEKGR